METPSNRDVNRQGDAALELHPERCVALRSRVCSCRRCVDVCTTRAIRVEEGKLSFDECSCTTCGACAAACPTGAIVMLCPSDKELDASLRHTLACGGATATVACRHAGTIAPTDTARTDGTDTCRVPCLGRVDVSLLLGLAAQGASSIELVSGRCPACANARGGAAARQVVREAQALLEACGSQTCIELLERGDADKDGGASGSSTPMAVGTDAERLVVTGPIKPDAQTRRLPCHVPARRLRLFRNIKALGSPSSKSVQTHETFSLVIDTSACTGCGGCGFLCPTGALRLIEEDNGGKLLAHAPALCVACGLCEQSCPRQAISSTPEVRLDRFIEQQPDVFPLADDAWVPNRPRSMFEKLHQVLGANVVMSTS